MLEKILWKNAATVLLWIMVKCPMKKSWNNFVMADEMAQEYLIVKYKNFVRSKARSYFLIGADREDIIQEGMIGLYKAIRDYRGDKLSSFRAFADLCITRQIITAIKTATLSKAYSSKFLCVLK